MLSIGLVGLPNAGKSTLFNLLTKRSVPAENFPFCTIEPNKAVVSVPDDILVEISRYVQTKKVTPATLEVIDIAGLIKGSHKGEGLGNQFLSFIQKVDAIAHIVRLFKDPHTSHIGEVEPIRDIQIVETELKLKDIEILEKRIKTIEKKAKSGDKDAKKEYDILTLLLKKISDNEWLKLSQLSEDEKKAANGMGLISIKPEIFIANVDEDTLKNPDEIFGGLKSFANEKGIEVIPISAKIEEEIRELAKEEMQEFFLEYGLEKGSLERIILAGYKLLKLLTFYTFNENELRAWTIKKGSTVLEAASKIHTDMAKGFIKAEVIPTEIFLKEKTMKNLREKGLLQIEGKDYVVKDGDILYIHFR